MVKPIAILGCGPAGLMCAHACVLAGRPFDIFSAKKKSHMAGAMYLHEPIRDITPSEPELEIQIVKLGVREGYAENVYGDPNAEVSWDKFEESIERGWRLDAAYARLWDLYEGMIIDTPNIGYTWLGDLLKMRAYDCVFSTIPKTAICYGAHIFEKQDVWIATEIDGHGSLIDKMVYNGYTPDGKYGMMGQEWYRYSRINGHQSWEYAHVPSYRDPEALSYGVKPLWNTCDCFPTVHKFGRFGKWKKGVLTHHAFNGALGVLHAL